MAGGFGTTTEDMERAGRHVLSVNEAVQTDLSTLRARLEPLAGVWRGLAAAEFVKLMARWDADARSLNEALRSIGEAIHGSARTYQQQDDQQSGGLSSIRAALG
ncbi:MAG: WXG100 family type VII secretion target [Pseudonocardia sp.]